MASIELEGDAELSSEILPSTEAVEDLPLFETRVEAEGPPVGVSDSLQHDKPLASRLADVPSSSAHERGKGIAEDGYEKSFDFDAEEVRMMGEGFTQLKVRLEGSMRTIAVPMDRDLLVDTENVVPSLGPLYSDVEGKTLEKLDDTTLSMSIVGLPIKTVVLEIESIQRE
ncbi:uncharacterized protein LOC107828511 [Nicotiana tabacum]|uniref:Uncharacterized protein LOC107828511 n=2 Tax=Nicotiana TaxID=4085 RepID=A0A1S4DD07_TOBAC|nr:PREDICTED: uncharacterized protein LOC104219121 [Nicotiana sylvestris]XP_016511330.1 PREDICTED: uncharacterized protein LOC107828511 [Nicotiana tabacum]